MAAARLAEQEVGTRHEGARRDVATLVQSRYDEYVSAVDQYTSLQSSLDLAEESLRSEQRAFAEGVGTSLEVVDAELARSRIQVERLNAQYDAVRGAGSAAGGERRERPASGVHRPMTTRLLLGVLLLAACGRDSITLQGETDAKQVNVATKVPGRVDSLFVREGDSVRRGQIVATLDGPEIRAKAAQALAARDAARAIRDKARHGSREEDVRAARNNWLRAVASATIAETTYARLDRLQREGVVPVQKRDEAEAVAAREPRGSRGREGAVRPGDGRRPERGPRRGVRRPAPRRRGGRRGRELCERERAALRGERPGAAQDRGAG